MPKRDGSGPLWHLANIQGPKPLVPTPKNAILGGRESDMRKHCATESMRCAISSARRAERCSSFRSMGGLDHFGANSCAQRATLAKHFQWRHGTSLDASVILKAGRLPRQTGEGWMKTITRLSLVAIFAVSLLATMGIGAAQAAKHHRHHLKHHRHHLMACPGKPGTIAALSCPHGKK